MSRAPGRDPRGEVVEWFMALVLKTTKSAIFFTGFEGF